MRNSDRSWSAAKSRERRQRDRIRASSIARHSERSGGVAAAVLLAVRAASAARGSRGHRLPMGLYDLDEPARMEGRLAADLRRTCKLHPAAERYAFRRVRLAHAGLYRAVGGIADPVRDARGGGVSRQISD